MPDLVVQHGTVTKSGAAPHPPRWAVIAIALAGLAFAAGAWWLHDWAVRLVYGNILPGWSRRYDSTVTLRSLSVSVLPALRLEGRDLTFRQHGREQEPPLLYARTVIVRAGLLTLLERPHRLTDLDVQGLTISLPPAGQRPRNPDPHTTSRTRFWIHAMRADGAVLRLLPAESGKTPAEFRFHTLRLRGSGVDGDLGLDAELTVPKPPGLVRVYGTFGPWDFNDAAQIHLSGKYELSAADLSIFHPVFGHVSSKGEFKGLLHATEVYGMATIPDFQTRNARHPVDFRSQFRAEVDATKGDVAIKSLESDFLRSHLTVHGRIAGPKQKTIVLDATMARGRLEDILRFVLSSAKPPFSGAASFRWHFEAPFNGPDMVDRLALTGTSTLAGVNPNGSETKARLDELSAKAQGEPDAGNSTRVLSDIKGQLAVYDGVAHLSDVSFQTLGVFVTLAGTYLLRKERLDLHGTARLEAELSQTTTGVKSFFLKIINPFFKRKHAGAVVPIVVQGPAHNPEVKMSLGR